MSLIIAVYVEEGLVLASDSRLTFNNRIESTDNSGKLTIVEREGVHHTDTAYKTFLCPNNIGISTSGTASINGKTITGYMENFIRVKMSKGTNIDDVPKLLNDYFEQFKPLPVTTFFAAGYQPVNKDFAQKLYRVPLGSKPEEFDTSKPGIVWDGEKDILSRLFSPLFLEREGKYVPHEFHEVPFNLYSLQDAIDFSQYAIKMTIDAMRFQMRPKTVGGEIDILVLKPNSSFWITHKELH